MKPSIILWKGMLGYALKGGGVVKSVFGEDWSDRLQKKIKKIENRFHRNFSILREMLLAVQSDPFPMKWEGVTNTESLNTETLNSETLNSETLNSETLNSETLTSETLTSEALNSETLNTFTTY